MNDCYYRIFVRQWIGKGQILVLNSPYKTATINTLNKRQYTAVYQLLKKRITLQSLLLRDPPRWTHKHSAIKKMINSAPPVLFSH